MSRIQTNIGLITGMPIGDTVDKLMVLAAKPRDMLQKRIDGYKAEQAAVTELSAYLISVKYITDSLGKDTLYDKRAVTSSDPNTLSATVTGDPPRGVYAYTPLRLVQSQQMLSTGVKSDTDPLGGGKFTFRFGSSVERSAPLELFGGGQGIERGKIRVTDRSGASDQIDLSTAQSVDDVLEAINGSTVINVTAVAQGDGIRLIDNTGQSVANLMVQEVGGGTTAASLGLAGIDAAAAVADGQDMIRLYEGMALDTLNDGNGMRISPALADVSFTLHDGTQGNIDFSAIDSGGSTGSKETTLGEILEVINEAAPGKLKAAIAPDGDRLTITDTTQGEATFQLSGLYGAHALEDLGLTGAEVDGVITGRRLLGGTQSVLLSSLDGGSGLGPLGMMQLTDRSGASDTVDLSQAETLDDVIQRIDAAGVGILARVNQAGNGIELVDTTGAYASNMIVANADATASADKLGIAVDDSVAKVDSGDLHLQIIAENTLLADLNGGKGVAQGAIKIVDSAGNNGVINLQKTPIETVGDLMREMGRLAANVRAEINETGDGIRLVDMAQGEGSLEVLEGNSTTARDLHLFQVAKTVDVDGQPTQVIDGTTTYTVELNATESLADLRTKINNLAAGVSATILQDGSSRPYRLSLTSDRPGKAGGLVVDTSEVNLAMQETVRAQDALLLYGDPNSSTTSVLVSSTSNTFRNVLPGATIEAKRVSTTPVVLSVDRTDVDLVANVRTFVDNYNRFRAKLNADTAYDIEGGTKAVLAGNSAALRLDTELSSLISGRFFGAGSIQSLSEIGIDIQTDGTLKLDESKLKARFAADPEAVKSFFTTERYGVSDKFDAIIEQMCGQDTSLLAYRFTTLRTKISQSEGRIEFMNSRLDMQRERLLTQFHRMELAIGKMQANLNALGSIQAMTPMASTSG